MRQPTKVFRIEFVVSTPDSMEEGIVYVSTRFNVVSHLCACGCKTEVVTPITPKDWEFTYDGETISLSPSIGVSALPCHSHYWIRRSQVKWAGYLSEKKVEKAIKQDKKRKNWLFNWKRKK
jgi:hypothetical protein